MQDKLWMRAALEEANKALAAGEVPVGAVLVKDGCILARNYNRREEYGDATAHAEMLVLRQACKNLGGWRLTGCTLYVTLEPCPMCAGALVQARVDRLVFGAADPKGGATGTLYNLVQDPRLNHRLEITSGVLAKPCGEILQQFFRQKR